MKRALLVAIFLAGCTGQPISEETAAAPTPEARPAASSAAQPASLPAQPASPPARPAAPPRDVKVPMPTSPAPPAPSDACGARDLRRLVGRPRSEIPASVNARRTRVTCTTCPVTMDYSPERLNIFFNAQTGIIEKVKCG